MADLDFITDRLATGGDIPTHRSDAEAETVLAEVVELGITHIVDNRVEWSDESFVLARAPYVAYLHNPADDTGQRMPDRWFDEGAAFVVDALQDPEAKVLVHCHMGINRGPSLAYAAMLALGWDPVAAIDAIRRARPIANVWYAEDALDWWHRRTNTNAERRVTERRALRVWWEANPLGVVRIIREVRRRRSRRDVGRGQIRLLHRRLFSSP